MKGIVCAIAPVFVASGLAGCVSLGTDVLEICESTIDKTVPIEVVAADVRNECIGEPQPVLCARAEIRGLRAATLDAASSLVPMANYYLDLAWGVDPSVAHGLRTRCPLAREHLLEMVNGLDALLAEVEDPTFWEPGKELNAPSETDAVEARLRWPLTDSSHRTV